MYHFDTDKLERLADLRNEGIEPYPHHISVSHTIAETLECIGDRDKETLTNDETVVSIGGRLMFKNEMGKAGFARIQDRSGVMQVYLRKNTIGDAAFDAWKKASIGDHIVVEVGL